MNGPGAQSPGLASRGAAPVSAWFNVTYFSLENGRAEARHVGASLPERFRPGLLRP